MGFLPDTRRVGVVGCLRTLILGSFCVFAGLLRSQAGTAVVLLSSCHVPGSRAGPGYASQEAPRAQDVKGLHNWSFVLSNQGDIHLGLILPSIIYQQNTIAVTSAV
jgi:hypothetical protein